MLSPLVRISFVVACCLASAMSGADAPAPLAVVFENNALVVTKVTPAGRVVFFTAVQEMTGVHRNVPTLVRRSVIVVDENSDGVVRLSVPEPVPVVGLWAVVDLSTGAAAVVPAPGSEPQRITVDDILKHDNAGQLRKVDWPASQLDLMIVRPGVGAWRLNARKYSALDESRTPHAAMRVDADSLVPVAGTAVAAQNFRKGDVVVLLDAAWMQYAVLEVGK